MVAEKTTDVNAMESNTNVDTSEKGAVLHSDMSSGNSMPGDFDDIPDPDVGKTPEERAKIVWQPLARSCFC